MFNGNYSNKISKSLTEGNVTYTPTKNEVVYAQFITGNSNSEYWCNVFINDKILMSNSFINNTGYCLNMAFGAIFVPKGSTLTFAGNGGSVVYVVSD